MKKNIFLYLLILLSVFYFGCIKRPIKTPQPILVSVEKSPTEIIAKLRENNQKLSSLRLEANGKKNSFDGAIVYQKPDALRLDAYVFWGKLLMIGSLLQDSLSLYLPTENWLIKSDVHSVALKEWIGFDIDFADLLLIFNGFSLYLDDISEANQILEIEENQYKLTIDKFHTRITFWINPQYFLINRAKIFDKITYLETNFVFEDYKRHKNIFWAKQIQISRPQLAQNLYIKNKEIEINPILDKEDFLFNVPKDTELYLLEE